MASHNSKSVMTPSLSGRTAVIESGVRPSICLASLPTAVPSPENPPAPLLQGDNRRLVHDHASTLHSDQRVRRPKVDGQIGAKPVAQTFSIPAARNGWRKRYRRFQPAAFPTAPISEGGKWI